MDALKAVTDWMRSTDLAEIAYRKNGKGFALTAAGAEEAAAALPAGRFSPVASEAVGVFQWSAPGRPRTAEEGAEVAAGDVLGVVETASGSKPVKAPAAGRVAKILVDAGQAVQYGQPILLLETR